MWLKTVSVFMVLRLMIQGRIMQIYREVRETSHLFQNYKTPPGFLHCGHVPIPNKSLLSRIRKYPEKIEKSPMCSKGKKTISAGGPLISEGDL